MEKNITQYGVFHVHNYKVVDENQSYVQIYRQTFLSISLYKSLVKGLEYKLTVPFHFICFTSRNYRIARVIGYKKTSISYNGDV